VGQASEPVAWARACRHTARVDLRAAYTADRAAALSGVPKSTVHYWARQQILVPSVSPERVKLWSYPDLMGLRTIYWLRQTKRSPEGREVPKTTMPSVRRALDALASLALDLWSEDGGPAVAVDRAGDVVLVTDGQAVSPAGQAPLDADMLDLMAPFETAEGSFGPDLRMPRPRLRIVPGKLAGAPHIQQTRVETEALGALASRGFPSAKIYRLYPAVEAAAVDEAIDLEHQLSRNLKLAA
jgi:uncharacterized protein (DUF433 family)